MYFWKIELLKDDLINNRFDDKSLLPYIILTIFLYTLGTEITAYIPYEEVNLLTYLLSFMNVLIPIIGTIYIYKKNGGANGKNFANRYITISFVIGIRFLVYLIPVMIILICYWNFTFSEQETIPTTLFEIVVLSLWYIILYYNIAKHIESLSKV